MNWSVWTTPSLEYYLLHPFHRSHAQSILLPCSIAVHFLRLTAISVLKRCDIFSASTFSMHARLVWCSNQLELGHRMKKIAEYIVLTAKDQLREGKRPARLLEISESRSNPPSGFGMPKSKIFQLQSGVNIQSRLIRFSVVRSILCSCRRFRLVSHWFIWATERDLFSTLWGTLWKQMMSVFTSSGNLISNLITGKIAMISPRHI